MKQCYTLILLCLVSSALFSQTRYWVGPSSGAGGAWNNTANWSASSGGSSGASVPNGSSFDAVFDQNALVNVDITSLTLNSLKITNNTVATLFTASATTMTLNSSTAGNEGLNIDLGSTLRDSVDANIDFLTTLGPSGTGEVDGDWYLGGNTAAVGSNGARFSTGGAGPLNINGRVFLRPKSGTPAGSTSSLFFNAGSFLYVERDGGITPTATWSATSTIRITGNVSNATTFNGSPPSLGNVEYDCAGLTSSIVSMSVNNNTTIKGYFKIMNTNGKKLLIASAPVSIVTITVQGNLEISGANTSVAIADGYNTYSLQVVGNFVQSNGTFSLQDNSAPTGTTSLLLKGNFTQTGGTFTSNSTYVDNTINYFVVELNGTSGQTINASTGTIDNNTNQVALKINNAAGVTLNSALSVGRLDFASGKITTTSSNLLTINNTDNSAFSINGVSNSSFVNGPVKRKTALASSYTFPVGKGSTYRGAEIIPSATTASEYVMEYFASGYSDLTVITPLTGVSNLEYWNAQRVLGANAQIKLSLNGTTAVPGATNADALVVAMYNSADWVSQKGVDGTKLTPGNATSGSVTSQTLNSFNNFFTFGYAPSASLPIKLTSFTAEKGSGYNLLHWKADCTSERAVFEIERSFDGKNFSRIETITADRLRCSQPFDLQDRTAGQSTVYYRIKMIDVDGSAAYSRIAVLIYKNKGFDIVAVYPTVVTTGQVKVNITSASSAAVELYITNLSGQVMSHMKVNAAPGENIIPINVSALGAGVYQLTGRNSEGELKTFRFIK